MDAKDLVAWALEASLHFEPRSPGLTAAELGELASQFGVTPIALDTQLRGRPAESGRIVPFGIDPSFFATYEGDLRNVRAFDHVVASFKRAAELAGQQPAVVDREEIVASGTAAGLPAADVEFAVAVYRTFEGVPEGERRWELRRIKPTMPLPSTQREGPAGRRVTRRERYSELVDKVRALVEKRPSRRPASALAEPPPKPAPQPARIEPPPPRPPAASEPEEVVDDAGEPEADEPEDANEEDPVAAFRDVLTTFGQGRLVGWWGQIARELRVADERGANLTKLVLSVTLVEAALCLVCPRPRDPKADPKAKPPRWGLPEAARAALKLGVGEPLRNRLERANRARVRMNVAKVLEASGPLPDCTAEEARDAHKAMRATLRAILAWNAKRR